MNTAAILDYEGTIVKETDSPTVLLVPGLRDHMPNHWQTLLLDQLPKAVCVPRMDTGKLSCAAWVTMLQASLAQIRGPVILVAHSAGCMIVAHWAQRHRRTIKGALLVTPPDFESPMPPGYPTPDVLDQCGWLPVPRTPLPFPSIVAASANDPLARLERVAELSDTWGSRLVSLGNVGHLNPAAGYGPWPRACQFIDELAA